MVRAARQKVELNKPIAVGFCILELSKLAMYEFYYGYLKTKYQNQCSLLFTDTDSFCCEIQTTDIYQDMSESMDLFDTSNFDTDHAILDTQSPRSWKDEERNRLNHTTRVCRTQSKNV